MGNWALIQNNPNKYRLLCNHKDCSLSICNLDNGRISITTLHGGNRHSMVFDNNDMIFIMSQFISRLSKSDREKLLEFYQHL